MEWIERDPDYCSCERVKRCDKDSCPESWAEHHRALSISRDLCIRVKHVELSNDRTGKPRFATLRGCVTMLQTRARGSWGKSELVVTLGE